MISLVRHLRKSKHRSAELGIVFIHNRTFTGNINSCSTETERRGMTFRHFFSKTSAFRHIYRKFKLTSLHLFLKIKDRSLTSVFYKLSSEHRIINCKLLLTSAALLELRRGPPPRSIRHNFKKYIVIILFNTLYVCGMRKQQTSQLIIFKS